MQHKTIYILFCKFALHVSGANHTHHQKYTKTATTVSQTRLWDFKWTQVVKRHYLLEILTLILVINFSFNFY